MLIAAWLYTALILPLSVLTRLTPVCLPGLIDFNADLEALVFAALPAFVVGSITADNPRLQNRLLMLWLLAQIFRVIDGPGMIPALFSLIMLLAFSVVLRARRPAVLAMLVITAGAIINQLGAYQYDQAMRQTGLMVGLTVATIMIAHWAWHRLRRWAANEWLKSLAFFLLQPWVVLIASGALIRLAFPYDYWPLVGAALLWLSGFLMSPYSRSAICSILKNVKA